MSAKVNSRLMVVAVLVVLIEAGSAWADLTGGLVAHWKLDGDATNSAGSNHGIIHGANTITGQINDALDFDDTDDYVEIPDNDSLTPSNQIAVSFWLYDRPGGEHYDGIVQSSLRI